MNITPIFKAVVGLLATIITFVIVPYIKSKTTATQQKEINDWIKIAVAAAEQIYKGVGRGEEKKQYALAYLAKHGIKLDNATIDAMIEAAVYALNNGLLITTEGESNAK